MTAKRQVEFVGAHGSGCRYLQDLVRRNLVWADLEPEWSARFVPGRLCDTDEPPANIHSVVVVQHPAAALVSLFESVSAGLLPHSPGGGAWEAFLTGRFVIPIGPDGSGGLLRFRDPIDYWNAVYYDAAALPPSQRSSVRLEDALIFTDHVLALIASDLGAEQAERSAKPVEDDRPEPESSGPAASIDADLATRTQYYRREDYLRSYTTVQMTWLAERVDRDVLAAWGMDTAMERALARIAVSASATNDASSG